LGSRAFVNLSADMVRKPTNRPQTRLDPSALAFADNYPNLASQCRITPVRYSGGRARPTPSRRLIPASNSTSGDQIYFFQLTPIFRPTRASIIACPKPSRIRAQNVLASSLRLDITWTPAVHPFMYRLPGRRVIQDSNTFQRKLHYTRASPPRVRCHAAVSSVTWATGRPMLGIQGYQLRNLSGTNGPKSLDVSLEKLSLNPSLGPLSRQLLRRHVREKGKQLQLDVKYPGRLVVVQSDLLGGGAHE